MNGERRNLAPWVTGLRPWLGGCVLGGLLAQALGDSGALDRGYQPAFTSSNKTAAVEWVGLQPDGALVVSGTFQAVDGVVTGPLARFWPSGELDPAFRAPLEAIRAVAALPDGRLVAGGTRILSLDAAGRPDGRIDQPICNAGLCASVALALALPDGSVLVAGDRLPLGVTTSQIVRFASSGELTPAWAPPLTAESTVVDLAADWEGRVLAAGRLLVQGESRLRFLLRLDPEGALDASFSPVLPVGDEDPGTAVMPEIHLAIQPDNRVVLASTVANRNGVLEHTLARLLPDGSLDPTFRSELGAAHVMALALQTDGAILVAARSSDDCRCRGQCLYRLQADGQLDRTFAPSFEGDLCSPTTIVQILPDGDRIVVAGSFTRVNGQPAPGLGMLNGDGTTRGILPATFEALGRVSAVTLDADGHVLVSGSFTSANRGPAHDYARLDTRGELDEAFAVRDTNLLRKTEGRLISLPDGGLMLLFTNRPVVKLLASGATDPSFVITTNLANLRTEFRSVVPDPRGRLVTLTVSNDVVAVRRLLPDGALDPGFVPFSQTGTRSWYATPSTFLTLDVDQRPILAGDPFTNIFRGVLRLEPDGGLDPSFGPLPTRLGGISAMVAGLEGRIALGLSADPYLIWLSADGRGTEGPRSLPPLPTPLRPYGLTDLAFDRKGRLYFAARTMTGGQVFRLSPAREWDPGFVVDCRGGFSMCLSPDGDWLYVGGATEVNGVRSGGLLRVSTLDTPRLEVLGASPGSGAQLRLHGEPDHWYRLETSADLDTWQPFLELPFDETPTWLTDWTAAMEPRRFYRLRLVPSP